MKSLGAVNLRYKMLPLVVTYNVASITKMGYKDSNNNEIFSKFKELVVKMIEKNKLWLHKVLKLLLHLLMIQLHRLSSTLWVL